MHFPLRPPDVAPVVLGFILRDPQHTNSTISQPVHRGPLINALM